MSRTCTSPLGVVLLIAGTLASDNSTSMSSSWILDRDWENNIDSSTILWMKIECRLIHCALLCEQDPSCNSFFHHPLLQTCLGSQSYKRGLPASQTVQQGWKYYLQPRYCDGDYEYNKTLGLCYRIYDIDSFYSQAMAFCEREGAKLIIFKNTDEFQHIINMIPEFSWTFIGLQGKDNGSVAVFNWWNGQMASNIAWHPGYPQRGYDSIVLLFGKQYLNKPFDTKASTFVCQKFI